MAIGKPSRNQEIEWSNENTLKVVAERDAATAENPELAWGYRRFNSVSTMIGTAVSCVRDNLFMYLDVAESREAKLFLLKARAEIEFLKGFLFENISKPLRRTTSNWGVFNHCDGPVDELSEAEMISVLSFIATEFDEAALDEYIDSQQEWMIYELGERKSTGYGSDCLQSARIPVNKEKKLEPSLFSTDVSYQDLDAKTKQKVDRLMQIMVNAMSFIAVGKDPRTFRKGLDMSWEDGTLVNSSVDVTDANEVSVAAWLSGKVGESTQRVRCVSGSPRDEALAYGYVADVASSRTCVEWADAWWETREAKLGEVTAGDVLDF